MLWCVVAWPLVLHGGFCFFLNLRATVYAGVWFLGLSYSVCV